MPKFYALCFFIASATIALHAESPLYTMSEKESTLSFQEVSKLVIVEASVNGMEGYFLFDTGIGALTLNERLFAVAETMPKYRKVTDINGNKEKLEAGFVESFRWGGVERDSFQVPLADLASLERILKIELMGLLGWEVFNGIEIVIDYDAREMTLLQLDEEGESASSSMWTDPDHTVPFEMELHVPVMRARIGDQFLRMGWDSGASINMMNRNLQAKLPEETRQLMEIAYGGVFSDRKAPFVACNAIYVDNQFAVTAWRMALSKMRHFEKRNINIDGLIGADLLRLGRVGINYQKKEISIWVNDNIFSLRYQPLENAGWARKNAASENK